jgi:sporulation protein YlmC with PRC-barrel domain
VFLSELLLCPVRSESGKEVGRLLDIRIEDERVSGVVVAQDGLIRRLLQGRDASGRIAPLEAVAWSDVVSFEPGRIVVSDSAARALGRRQA